MELRCLGLNNNLIERVQGVEHMRQGLTLVHFRLNVSASCGIGGAFRGCVAVM